MPAHWLIKSEPEVFSLDDLLRAPRRTTAWEGVRNFQARNFLRAMRAGDLAIFYHSNAEPSACVGTVTVVREAYPDPTQFDAKSKYFDADSSPADPRWSLVDVAFASKFARPVPLDEIRRTPGLGDMVLVKRSRLSVQPVTAKEWAIVLRLGAQARKSAGR